MGPVLLLVGGRVLWPGFFDVVSGGRVRPVASCCFVVRGGRLSWLFGVVVCPELFRGGGGFSGVLRVRAGVLPGFCRAWFGGFGGCFVRVRFCFPPGCAPASLLGGVWSGWVGVLLRFFRLVVRPPGLPSFLVVGGGCWCCRAGWFCLESLILAQDERWWRA